MEHRRAQTEISRPSKTPSETIKKLLFWLAETRQAKVTEATYESYSRGLQGFSGDDLRLAIGTLCLMERAEGQTSFPTLATIISETQRAASKRFERQRQEKEREEYAYVQAHPDEFVSFKELMECRNRLVALRAGGHVIPIPQRNAPASEMNRYLAIAEGRVQL